MKTIHVDIKTVLLLFDLIAKDNSGIGFKRNEFYCGITNNLEKREKQHNAKFLCSVLCDSKDTAIEVEAFLGKNDYDIGAKAGNGAKENSVYVYIYKITPATIQDVSDDE